MESTISMMRSGVLVYLFCCYIDELLLHEVLQPFRQMRCVLGTFFAVVGNAFYTRLMGSPCGQIKQSIIVE